MNNKYRTGKYQVLLFDKHGTQNHSIKAENYISALAIGEMNIQAPPHASFVVIRTLFNSLDLANPWSCRDETKE